MGTSGHGTGGFVGDCAWGPHAPRVGASRVWPASKGSQRGPAWVCCSVDG